MRGNNVTQSTTALQAVFWDMDGTLINSEPYWHESELEITRQFGGYWDEDLAWKGSGRPVPQIAHEMIDLGCPLSAEEIEKRMIQYVAHAEKKCIPWIPGVYALLEALRDAGIPNVLVTTSPRELAENLVAHAPQGAFVDYICGDDAVAKKPDPAPYLLAAQRLGIEPAAMPWCIACEDSRSGLQAAAASGATTIAQTGYMRNLIPDGPQYISIDGYEGITVAWLNALVQQRCGEQ